MPVIRPELGMVVPATVGTVEEYFSRFSRESGLHGRYGNRSGLVPECDASLPKPSELPLLKTLRQLRTNGPCFA